MENISHSFPNRSFTPSSNGGLTSHKSVYDDVFGGPPKSGIPTLAPRLEDYTEIFGGFHASRSSSIPVLNIPLIGDDSELHFDARSPGFSYGEVFGGFRGLEWTASFEDVVRQSSGGYYDSDEQWSPAQSGSLSDEINPLAGSDTSHRLSDGDADPLENNQQFNMSYNKSSPRVVETMLAGTTHVTKFSAAPGYTCSSYETPVTWNGENNYCTMHVTNNINCSKDSRVTIPQENNYKCFSNPLGTDCYVNENEIDLAEKHESDTSSFARPFMTVSDISLRTKPSRLPPPSRPPPALAVKKGERDRSFSKLKASKSYAFETEADDSGQLFFDVEVDVTLSAEGMERRNKDVRLKWDNTKELTEKKNESWSHAKWNLEKVEKMSKKVSSHSSFKGENVCQSYGEITRESAFSVEEAMGSRKVTEEAPESLGGPYSNHITDKFAGPVAWREEKEYFEVVEKNISSEPFDTVEDRSIFTQFKNPEVYRSLKISEAFDQKEDKRKPKVTILAPRWNDKMNQPKMARDDCVWGNKQRRKNTQIGLCNQKDFQEKVILNKLSASTKRMEVDKRFRDAFKMKDNDGKHEENIVREEYHRKIENVGRAEIRERLKERIEQEGFKRQQYGACLKGNENKLNESHVLNEMLKHADKYAVAHEIKGGERHPVEVHKEKERLIDADKQRLNELTFRTIFQRAGNDKVHEADLKWEVMNERKGDDSLREDNNLSFPKAEPGNAGEICEPKENKDLSRDAGLPEFFGGDEEIELVERDWHETEANLDLDSDVLIQGDQVEMLEGESKLGEGTASKLAGEHNYPLIVEKPEAVSCDGNMGLKTQPYFSANESEAGVIDSLISKGKLNISNNKEEVQDGNTRIATNNTAESPSSPKQMTDSNIGGTGRGFTCNMPDKTGSTEEIIPMEDDDDQKMKGTRVINEKVDISDSSTPCQLIKESIVNGRKREDVSSVLEHNEDPLNQSIKRNDKNMKENLVMKDQKVGDKIRREIELESEHLRKIEEERERKREREKDRMAVDKAALERSSVEARERAERAAVERATVEVRRRAIAVAREKLDNASVEARHRAERASVERATAEARQRAAEKLMAEKTVFERVEKPVSDRFSASSRSVDTKQSSFSYDIHFPHTGISSGIGHAYSSSVAEGESPQRCKARLDRYKRTAERAANALAEKNRRDLLVQIESEERNRVAEALDAEVKRWSKGKEGNLRALLSTLQYILGPDSGWQPIPLTEVITSTAVKRAYRKATLCVHPDKLQQRSASVQQKYTCEKVFDLLKEAWNKFNSEER